MRFSFLEAESYPCVSWVYNCIVHIWYEDMDCGMVCLDEEWRRWRKLWAVQICNEAKLFSSHVLVEVSAVMWIRMPWSTKGIDEYDPTVRLVLTWIWVPWVWPGTIFMVWLYKVCSLDSRSWALNSHRTINYLSIPLHFPHLNCIQSFDCYVMYDSIESQNDNLSKNYKLLYFKPLNNDGLGSICK